MMTKTYRKTIILVILLSVTVSIQFAPCQNILPNKAQLAWSDAELGVIIHLDINIYAPDTFDYNRKETLPGLNLFNPSKLNTDQWVRTAKAAGARYAILTVKHGTGFGLWPSKVNPYNVGHTKWRNGKGDILKDFIRSCKKYGVSPGLYYNTNSNTYYEAGRKPFVNDSARMAYNTAVLQQLKELWTAYGKMFEIWFDGGIADDHNGGIHTEVVQLLNQYQKEAILFQGPLGHFNTIRWIGNEDGIAAYPQWSRASSVTAANGMTKIDGLHGNPDGRFWCPGESDFPIRRNYAWNGGWLWKIGEEKDLFTVNELKDKYLKSVGRNTNMLVGMVVDSSGLIPRPDSLVFDSLGKTITALFIKPVIKMQNVYGKSPTIKLSSYKNLHMVVISENIAQGERIRKYIIEAKLKNKWRPIADGESIGYKRIQIFPVVFTNQIRIRIIKSVGAAHIKQLSFY